ncbi:hypothetical protein AHAS_Ahas19G0114300 [Arachis hypogaea]
MSSTATLIGSISTTPHFSSSNTTTRTRFRTRTRTFSSTPQSLNHSFFRLTNAPSKRASSTPFHGFKRFSPVMEWQDCTVKTEVDVPVSVAYACYSDREAIPNWMPFISSVKILPDKPDLSRWSLNYKAFGRDIEFSWLARNMQERSLPIPNQKIHWRSLEGLPNRGAVRFYPKGTSSCVIELTVSYEVPQLLAPVASALQPFLANLLERAIYASPVPSKREEAWNVLTDFSRNYLGPLLAIGDFNEILLSSEVKGGNFVSRRAERFGALLDECGLIDFGANGSLYTWFRHMQGNRFISKRLDRAVATDAWCFRFPESYVENLVRMHSDHCPIMIRCQGVLGTRVDPILFVAFLSSSQWVMECSGNSFGSSVIKMELWSIWRGLAWAWEVGLKLVVCETDCASAFELVTSWQVPLWHLEKEVIQLIFDLKLRRDWDIRFELIPREANVVADRLAKMRSGGSGADEVHLWHQPPEVVCPLLLLRT